MWSPYVLIIKIFEFVFCRFCWKIILCKWSALLDYLHSLRRIITCISVPVALYFIVLDGLNAFFITWDFREFPSAWLRAPVPNVASAGLLTFSGFRIVFFCSMTLLVFLFRPLMCPPDLLFLLQRRSRLTSSALRARRSSLTSSPSSRRSFSSSVLLRLLAVPLTSSPRCARLHCGRRRHSGGSTGHPMQSMHRILPQLVLYFPERSD